MISSCCIQQSKLVQLTLSRSMVACYQSEQKENNTHEQTM